jgi:hypothetical protein
MTDGACRNTLGVLAGMLAAIVKDIDRGEKPRGQERYEESGFSRMPRTATGATMELREARIASRTKLHQEDCRKNPPKVFLVKRTKANSAPRRFREPAKAGSLLY